MLKPCQTAESRISRKKNKKKVLITNYRKGDALCHREHPGFEWVVGYIYCPINNTARRIFLNIREYPTVAQLVKSLADYACSLTQEVTGSTPGADGLTKATILSRSVK